MSTAIFTSRESEIRGYCRVYPVVFDRAENACQYDEDGKRYLDFFAGAGVLNFGHNNPKMKEAVLEYIQNNGVLHSLDMHSTAKRTFMELFEQIILEPRRMPHKMQFVGPTGTNAVEAALKLARRVTGRREIVSFTHAFHGMTLGSLSCTANEYFRGAAGVPLEHVRHAPFGCEPVCRNCSLGCGQGSLDQLRALYEDSSSGVDAPAAFLVETIQAEGGVNVAGKAWLEALAQLAKDVGALLIVDDIQVGVGRTGSFFSFDNINIDPDIVCMAKGVGGMGTPLAFNLIKPEYDAHWNPGEHTGTFRGQNLSFVAGAEALKFFRNDEFMQQVQAKARVMRQQLEPLAGFESIQLRGKGMIIGIDLGAGDKAKAVVSRCFEQGVLVSACGTGGRVVKLIPPLTIPDDQLKEGLAVVVEAVQSVEAGL